MPKIEKAKDGISYPPGSPEDLELTAKLLGKFFTAKAKLAADRVKVVDATGATWSICHIDGKDDADQAKV